jgi:hypothetical protein
MIFAVRPMPLIYRHNMWSSALQERHRSFGLLLSIGLFLVAGPLYAQVDEDDTGAWYMYFFNAASKTSQWGLQGDVQYRNWDLGGDLEQLLLRGGVTWRPKSADAMFTLGYANITSGEFGSSSKTVTENRTYQEALLPQKISQRFYLRHRFRFEQRWVDDQNFRTRFRYALFLDVPLNRTDLKQGAWYFAFYDEIFLNGESDIGDGNSVETFDRNRLYGALGYSLSDTLRLQGGYMYQSSENVSKGQIQLSLHQTF